jgi:Cd2+/Zn2+-exporting ATPase/Cu+-exporting ATPase
MAKLQTLEIPVGGMDCAECTQHVRQAIARLPGVASVDVLLSSEKAVIRLDPALVGLPSIRSAVEAAGYSVPGSPGKDAGVPGKFGSRIATLLAIVVGGVLFVVVIGEWFGLIEQITERVPFAIGVALVIASGWTLFLKVVRAALKREITSHALMSLGALAALTVGEWATAAVVVFFMRVGQYAERLTTEGARRAVRGLTAMAPQTARVEREGVEHEVPVVEVGPGEVVVVRPGERIPVDGEVLDGHATVDQSALTGESIPAEVGRGSRAFAATIAQNGGLRLRATGIGTDTTFGRVVKMVEEAEANRGDVQRLADRFSAYYLPLVAGLGLLTLLIGRKPLAAAAVLVVACSCSIALATPIAMLASIGAAARRGLLIKGGKYLEALARADVLLIDKTGTLTLGRLRVTDVVALNGLRSEDVLALAASAERYSEHPLAEAVRREAREQGLLLVEAEDFESIPGMGVRARIAGRMIRVGNARLVPEGAALTVREELEGRGKSLLYVERDGDVCGVVAAADTLRPEVPTALGRVRALGVTRIELITGDNERAASALARSLGLDYRASLLPEDKIAAVRDLQAAGHIVVMVGDGVNDAPALVAADLGIAIGTGTDVAIEAADLTLVSGDLRAAADAILLSRRTLTTIKGNLFWAFAYNIAAIPLAAVGLLNPMIAAGAMGFSSVFVVTNSLRLRRFRSLRS